MIQQPVSTPLRRSRFWLLLGLFALPFALVFILFTGLLVYSGESMPLAIVVQMQMGDAPVLFRPRYGSPYVAFKALSVNMRRPELIILGSSRVMQIRSMFFNRRADAFYNAGGSGFHLSEVDDVLRAIEPQATPKVILLGLDQIWFRGGREEDEAEPSYAGDYTRILDVNRSVTQSLLEGQELDFGALLMRRDPSTGGMALGIDAIDNGRGLRNDGSQQYGPPVPASELEAERQNDMDDLRALDGRYMPGDSLSEDSLRQLDGLLSYCREHNIVVVGYLPPFTPTSYAAMVADGQHTYLQKLPVRLDQLFVDYGYHFFDFTDGATIGLSDEDFLDGWHGSEHANVLLYLRLLQALPQELGPYTDPQALKLADETAADPTNIFGTRFRP